jgi:hypothetical protein
MALEQVIERNLGNVVPSRETGLHADLEPKATPKNVKREIEGDIVLTIPEGWTDDKLKVFSKNIKEKAKSARAFKEQVRGEMWNLYNGIQDFSQKADWQSKETLSKVFMMVESVCSFIKTALNLSKDYFDVYPINKKDPTHKTRAFLAKQLIKYYAKSDDFINEFVMALKYGFLSELYIQKYYFEEVEKYTVEPDFSNELELRDADETELPAIRQKILKKNVLRFPAVNPSNIYLDPSGRKRYIIESSKVDISDLYQLASENKVRDVIDKIKSKQTQKLEDVKEKQKVELITGPEITGRIEISLDEFWGEVWDSESGKNVFRNVHWIVANEEEILLGPEPIRFYDGEAPYVIGACVEVPGSIYHKSLIEPIIGEAKLLNEIVNLAFDSLVSAMLNVYEVNIDAVQNMADLAEGIGPNTVIQKTTNEKVLNVEQVGKLPGEAFAGIQFLKGELEEGTAITRGMYGFSATTKRQTKGETQLLSAGTSGFFAGLVQDIERNFLAPGLTKMWNRIVQFQDVFTYPKLKDLIGEEAAHMLEAMSPQERYDVINGDYEIKVTGISGIIKKQEDFQKITAVLRIIARSQEMMSYIELKELLFQLFEMLNLDSSTLLRDQPAIPAQVAEAANKDNPKAKQVMSKSRGSAQGRPRTMEDIVRAMGGGGTDTVQDNQQVSAGG